MDGFLRAHADAAFVWGVWDCALMAAAHIDALTASELYVEHAGHYDSEAGAAGYLASLGFSGLGALAASVLGSSIDNVRFAQRGDVVSFDTDLGMALGLVSLCGTRIIGLNPSKPGFIRLPRDLAIDAWRV